MKKYILLLLFILLLNLSFAQTPGTLDCDAPDGDTTQLDSVPWIGNNQYL